MDTKYVFALEDWNDYEEDLFLDHSQPDAK